MGALQGARALRCRTLWAFAGSYAGATTLSFGLISRADYWWLWLMPPLVMVALPAGMAGMLVWWRRVYLAAVEELDSPALIPEAIFVTQNWLSGSRASRAWARIAALLPAAAADGLILGRDAVRALTLQLKDQDASAEPVQKAVLEYLAVAGIVDALPVVANLAATARGDRLREAAVLCRDHLLQVRADAQRGGVLLRPADPVLGGALLRPVTPSGGDELLRPVGDDAAGPGATRP